MADNGVGAFDQVACIRDLLEAMRNDVKLHPVLVNHTVPYLKDVAVGQDAEEVKACMPTEHSEWMDTFNESWQAVSEKLVPNFIAARARTWAGVPIEVSSQPAQSKPDIESAYFRCALAARRQE
eukprot:107252-Prymnesium_polylepis.1